MSDYRILYYWYCCMCGDGPKTLDLRLECVMCNHRRCNYCEYLDSRTQQVVWKHAASDHLELKTLDIPVDTIGRVNLAAPPQELPEPVSKSAQPSRVLPSTHQYQPRAADKSARTTLDKPSEETWQTTQDPGQLDITPTPTRSDLLRGSTNTSKFQLEDMTKGLWSGGIDVYDFATGARLEHQGNEASTEKVEIRDRRTVGRKDKEKARRNDGEKGEEKRVDTYDETFDGANSEVAFSDSGYGSASSSSNASFLAGAADELASDFLRDEHLLQLLHSFLGSDTVSNERFRQILVTSLRKYSSDLKGEAYTSLEKDAYRLVRSRAAYLTWVIICRYGYALPPSEFENLPNGPADRSKLLEDFLAKHQPQPSRVQNFGQPEEDVSDDGEAESMPNLAQMRRFLFDGQPFAMLLERIRVALGPKASTEFGLTIQDEAISIEDEKPQPSSIPDPVFSAPRSQIVAKSIYPIFRVSRWINQFFEPPVAPEMTRIRWTCCCGKALYDDYKELVPGAANALERQLINSFNRGKFGSHQSQSRTAIITGLQSLFSSLTQRVCGIFRRTPEESLPMTRQSGSSSQQQTSANTNGNSLFLLLCTHLRMGRETKLVQGKTENLKSDQDFFGQLKDLHDQKSGPKHLKSLFTIRKIQEIRFVQFELLHNNLVNNIKATTENSWPNTSEYELDLSECNTHPPIASNILTHLFENPYDADPFIFLVKRIPRRKKEELRICQIARNATGWGLYLVPGVDWTRVCTVALLFLLLSMAFGILWSVFRNVSEGFQVTSCLMVLITFTAGSMHGRT